MNACYLALRHSFGFGNDYFLPGPGDRFADLLKIALSFDNDVSLLVDSPAILDWPMDYRNYLLHNPYHGVEGLAAGRLTHFHSPPLSALSFTLCAKLIAATASPTFALWVWFGIFSLCFFWLAATFIRELPGSANRTSWLPLAICCLISYPTLCVITRGNYQAGFAALLGATFLVSTLGHRNTTWAAMLALALAINFRPVAVIFLAALPLSIGLRAALRPLTATVLMTALIFFSALFLESRLYPDYGLHSFLGGLAIYNTLYIYGSGGDAGNASLWALVKNGATMTDTFLYYEELVRILATLSFLTVALAFKAHRIHERNGAIDSFLLVALYVLLFPICAEYHLLVFVAPMAVLALTDPMRISPVAAAIVFWSAVLQLVPKNYVSIDGLSIQTLLNPAMLMAGLIFLQFGFSASRRKVNTLLKVP